MPFPTKPTTNTVEYKLTPRMGKQTLSTDGEPPRRPNIITNVNAKPLAQASSFPLSTQTLFYNPNTEQLRVSVPPMVTTSSNFTVGAASGTSSESLKSSPHSLPDIGAPDITAELLRSGDKEQQVNYTSATLPERKQSLPCDNVTQKTKTVFYTHSMKKKSTEPKFV